MKKMKLLGLLGLCSTLFFTRCSSEEMSLPNPQPTLQATINIDPEEPCSGTIVSEYDHSILDDNPPTPFELEIITAGDIPVPASHCECKETKVCVTFNFDKSTRHGSSHRILKKSTLNEQTHHELIFPNRNGGYTGYPVPHQFVAAASRVYRTQFTPSEIDDWNVLCFTPTDAEAALMIDFGLDVPYDYDPDHPVESVIGLCIVDNISDPSE